MDFSKVYDSRYSKSFDQGLRSYMVGIYTYVALALLVTGVCAFLTFNSPVANLVFKVTPQGVSFTGLGMLLSLSPMFIGMYFFWGFGSLSLDKARLLFWVYSATMGVSLSSLGYMYTGTSLVKTFFMTSASFGGMSIYGYSTKRDLTSFGSFLVMGLIGILIVSLVNIFLQSPAIYFATSIIGVFIFLGLIAWDTQKIKRIYYSAGGGEVGAKYSILAAFQLYLNFVNLFLYLIRFTGDRNK